MHSNLFLKFLPFSKILKLIFTSNLAHINVFLRKRQKDRSTANGKQIRKKIREEDIEKEKRRKERKKERKKKGKILSRNYLGGI